MRRYVRRMDDGRYIEPLSEAKMLLEQAHHVGAFARAVKQSWGSAPWAAAEPHIATAWRIIAEATAYPSWEEIRMFVRETWERG
jgi:hypothetical protein